MNKLTLSLVAASIALTGAACAADTKDPLPVGSDEFPTTATTVAAGVVEEVPTTVTTAAPAPAASTCDVVREALLTGTPAEIKSAMAALQVDKTADATAREYASEYLTETNASLQEMNVSLIRMSCS